MSLEVNVHAAQTTILRELLFHPAAGFAELQKPTGLTSDHFTFHINRLVELGLVERVKRGQYALSVRGKEYANRLDTDERTMERQGKLAVLIVPVREREGRTEYMVQRRLKQPFYGWHGYMTGKLRWGETVLAGAARELDEEAGLEADLVLKAVYHKLDYATDGRSLEDKHFYVVEARQVRGEFKKKFDGGENFWLTMEEIMALENVFEGMDRFVDLVQQPHMVFWEKAYHYELDKY